MTKTTNSSNNKVQKDRHKFVLTEDAKISRSCDFCKLKKVKCDGTKPSCNYCLNHGEKCVYSQMKKPGLKAGYGQQVFDRLASLEGSFKKTTTNSRDEIELLKKRMGLFEEKLNMIDSNNVVKNWPCQGPSSITSAPNSALNPVLASEYNTHFNTIQDDINISDPMLPSVNQIKRLIDIYFEKVNPIFPILCPTITVPKLLESVATTVTPLLLGVILCALRFAKSIMPREEI